MKTLTSCLHHSSLCLLYSLTWGHPGYVVTALLSATGRVKASQYKGILIILVHWQRCYRESMVTKATPIF